MIDTAVLWVRAEAAMRAGRWPDALAHLGKLIQVVDRIDFEYEEWLRALRESLRASGRQAEATACAAYLGDVEAPDAARYEALLKAAREGTTGALAQLRLYGLYLSRAGRPMDAARWFAAGGMPIHQAISLEQAGRDQEAAELWARLIDRDALVDRGYEQALVRINYGLCLYRLGTDQAKLALAEAITAVEEAADDFEREGLRERAFDCYQLLARLGLETKTFENVAEGYLNSVRILRDDGLKLDALRLYEAFVTVARQAGEYHAAAGILREAAETCTRAGLPYGEDLRFRCGEAWITAAEEAQASGLPVQIVENSYLAAAEAFVSVRAFRQAAGVYSTLAAMELKNTQRYQRLLRLIGERPEDAPRGVPVPEFLKRLPDYEQVWYVDLAEWEVDGDPLLISAGIMADRRFPDFVRRHALLLELELLRSDGRLGAKEVIERLRKIRAYPVISALEQFYERGDVSIRKDVADALGHLRFKRSFAVLTKALQSEDAGVRKEAAGALRELYFPHAFDRLRRVFESRDLPDAEEARQAALRAIGKINTVEAVEFLCDRLREGKSPYVGPASRAVSELSNSDLAPFLRQQIDLVPPAHRGALEEAAQRLGG